jgi:DNA-directed RNA polymerase subunit omega
LEDIVARITIDDCLKRVPNRFQLVNMASKRVRQIREGSEYLVSSPKNEDIVVALREIAAGKVVIREEIVEEPVTEEVQEITAAEPDKETASKEPDEKVDEKAEEETE